MPRRHHRPPHQPLSRETSRASCSSKQRFHNQESAQAAAETRMLQHMSLQLSSYHCPYCLGWHLTSLT